MVGGDLGEARRGVDLETGAGGYEEGAGLRDRHRLAEHHGVQRLAEHHRRRLEDAAAVDAGRVVLAGRQAGQGVLHRRPRMALRADDRARRAVQFQHLAVRHAAELAQTVHVLRDHPHRRPGPLQLRHRTVRGVRLGQGGEVLLPHPPRPAADLRVGHVVLVRHELLGVRVAAPQPGGSAVVGDAGVRADAGAGQEGDEGLAHAARVGRTGRVRRADIAPVSARGGRPPAPPCPSRPPARRARPAPGGPGSPAGAR